jgi:hypothetical protein
MNHLCKFLTTMKTMLALHTDKGSRAICECHTRMW